VQPNPRMQLAGASEPAPSRAPTSSRGIRTIGLCGREHDHPQLMRKSLGRSRSTPTDRMEANEYYDIMSRCGGDHRELDRNERWQLMQRWREVFAVSLHAKTGKWKLDEFEWAVFSNRYTRALAGGRAMEAYCSEQADDFFVVPEDAKLPAFECQGSRLPDFNAAVADVYVWPEDLSWTMAFTHEANLMELGPYFSRRDWSEQIPWRGGAA
jgi:hypothetical protein